MKKIISVLAMALLVIGAAQAQEQARYMFIQKTNGQQVRIPTEEIQDVTFKMLDVPSVPTTVEEAQAMIIGYWKFIMPSAAMYPFEGLYIVITEDFKAFQVFKVPVDVPEEEEWLAPYADKYISFDSTGLVFFSELPTTIWFSSWGGFYINNLHMNGFDLYDDNSSYLYSCERVAPFEYIMIEEGYLSKGKPAIR